jgi:hypothetical protein
MHGRALVSLAWSLCLASSLAACRGAAATPETPPAGAQPAEREAARSSNSRIADQTELPEEEAPPPSLWPEAPQPIAAELARTETREACAARVQGSLSAEVAESIEALGYDRFVEDLCGGLAAVRAGDVAACDALSVSSARSSCRRRLALVHGRPDACPHDPSVSGREPVCVAWAARDAGLCRGASVGERERCEAVLAGQARLCRALPPELRARCTAEVSRYGAALGRERVTSAARDVVPELALSVTVEPEHARARPADPDAALQAPPVLTISAPSLERGIVVARCADGFRARVGDARRHGSVLRLDGPAEAEFLLRWPLDARPGPLPVAAAAHDAVVRLRIPRASDVTSELGGAGTVSLEAHAPTRGALFAGTVELTLPMPGGRGLVTGRFRTFVRDVLDADAEECTR